MSIDSTRTALASVLGTAASAKVTWDKLPAQPPARLPALMVRWVRSVPSASAFSALSAGKSITYKRRRVHEFNAVLLIAMNGNTPDEDADARAKAQAMMDAIDNDSQLSGACVEARITEATPQAFTWGDAAYYAVQLAIETTED